MLNLNRHLSEFTFRLKANETILNNKRFILLIVTYCLCNNFLLLSQTYIETGGGGAQSPDVSNFNTYSSTPISYYTGTPKINIPLYEIKIKGLNVPVSLSYNINNVKPNNHPGATGLGWTLFCGGSISRCVKGRCDDSGTLGFLDHEDRLSDASYNARKFMSLSDMFLNGLWYDESIMSAYACSESMDGFDTSPDEFTFDFLGFSGKFYRNHEGEWQVASNTAFRVKHELIEYSNVRSPLNNITRNAYGARTINKFELTAPDGTIYKFGGQEATDYSFNYFYQKRDLPKAMTWHLSEIITPESNSIQFKYQVEPPQLSGDMNFYLQTNFEHDGYQGVDFNIVMPVYLKSVSMNNLDIITFNYQASVQEKYPSQYFYNTSDPYFSTVDLFKVPEPSDAIFASYSQCEWQELSNITMPNGVKYKFTYNNLSQERLKLLSIEEVDGNSISKGSYEFGYNSTKFPKYLSGHYDHLGFYNGSDFSFLYSQTFYSRSYGSDLKDKSSTYYNKRSADNTGNFVNAEMLESIKHPTGGKTVFEYEPHYVSGTVSYDETTDYKLSPYIISKPMYPGGIRIKRVIEYLSNNEFSKSKRYYYINNFDPSTKTGTSSGVLSFTPTYFWDLTLVNLIPEPMDGFYIWNLQIFTSLSTLQSYSNSSGNYVGYSEVVECDEDKFENIKGYTKYSFTNFTKDIWGNSHFDEPAINRLNVKWQRATNQLPHMSLNPVYSLNGETSSYKQLDHSLTPFTPFSSKSMERGKVTSKIIYDLDNHIKQATYFKYALSSNDYVRSLDLFVTPITSIVDTRPLSSLDPQSEHNFVVNLSGYFALGGAYKTYIGDYQIIEKNEELFNSTTPITTKTFYKYTTTNLLSQEKMITSRNDTISTNYCYPSDLPFQMLSNTVHNNLFIAMVTNRFLNYPIEITKFKNSKVINSKVFHYGFHGNNFAVDSVFTTQTSSLISDFKPYLGLEMDKNYEKQPSFSYLYDSHSNVIQETAKSGIKTTYLWSYDYQYPISEIKNATYDQVKTLLGVDPETIAASTTPDMSKVNGLRSSLPNALVTTYTYKPLVGMTSMTDPRGVTTNYTYDTFNRLYLASNDDKNILSRYRYGYQNAPDNGQGGYTAPVATVTPGATFFLPGTTGTATLSSVSGGSGSFTYSWYVKTSTGTVLASNLNTTSTSFSFICYQPGTLTIQCVITDNVTGLSSTPSTTFVSGVAPVYGNFYTVAGYQYPYTSLYKMLSTVIFRLVFLPTSFPMNVGTDYHIADVPAGFIPSGLHTFSFDTGGRTWYITINGVSVYCRIVSGTPLPAWTTAVDTGTLSYNL